MYHKVLFDFAQLHQISGEVMIVYGEELPTYWGGTLYQPLHFLAGCRILVSAVRLKPLSSLLLVASQACLENRLRIPAISFRNQASAGRLVETVVVIKAVLRV